MKYLYLPIELQVSRRVLISDDSYQYDYKTVKV